MAAEWQFKKFLAKDQKFPKQMFLDELSRRSKVPVFSSEAFGHASLNMPLMIGSRAKIMNDSLEWSSNEIK